MSAPHYMVFEVDLKTDDWVPAYQEGAPPVLADYGGKYLALTPSLWSLVLWAGGLRLL